MKLTRRPKWTRRKSTKARLTRLFPSTLLPRLGELPIDSLLSHCASRGKFHEIQPPWSVVNNGSMESKTVNTPDSFLGNASRLRCCWRQTSSGDDQTSDGGVVYIQRPGTREGPSSKDEEVDQSSRTNRKPPTNRALGKLSR